MSGADPQAMTLRPMTQQEYDAWYPGAVKGYAEQHIEAGSMPADTGHDLAAQQFAELLPNGVDTAAQRLLIGEVDGVQVGMLWLNIATGDATAGKPVTAFVYDVEVDPAHRGKGYGRALMLQGEEYAVAEGAVRIRLHVFGENTVARGLYHSIGFTETNVSMTKELGAASTDR